MPWRTGQPPSSLLTAVILRHNTCVLQAPCVTLLLRMCCLQKLTSDTLMQRVKPGCRDFRWGWRRGAQYPHTHGHPHGHVCERFGPRGVGVWAIAEGGNNIGIIIRDQAPAFSHQPGTGVTRCGCGAHRSGGRGKCGRRDWQKMRKNAGKMRKMREKMR